MTTVERINPEIIEHYEQQDFAPESLDASNIYDRLETLDDNPYRMTEDGATVAGALEDTLLFYTAISHQFDSGGAFAQYDLNVDADEQDQFIRSYAMFAACAKGLDDIGAPRESGDIDTRTGTILGYDEDTLEQLYQQSAAGNSLSRGELAIQAFVKEYAGLLDELEDPDALVERTADYLHSVSADCYDVMAQHPDYLDAVESTNLEINGFTLNGLSGNGAAGGNLDIPDTDWEDIIGNENAKDLLKESVWKTMAYRVDDQASPFQTDDGDIAYPYHVLMEGPPGTGKTLTIGAALNFAHEQAQEYDKPIEVRKIEARNIGSKYKNESSQNLENELQAIMDPEVIGFGVLEDVDALVADREEVDDDPEEGKIVGTLLNMMEGIESSPGSYMLMATTNKPTNLDDAFKNRWHQQIHVPGPEDAEEAAELAEHILSHHHPAPKNIRVDEWDSIGEQAHEYGFVGRELRNATLSLIDRYSESTVGDETLMTGDLDEAVAAVQDTYEPITDEDVLNELEQMHEDLEQQEERAKTRRIRNRIRREALQEVAENSSELDEEISTYEELLDGE